MGHRLTLVDFTVYFSLQVIIHFAKGKYDKFLNVKEWYDRMYEIPEIKEVTEGAIAALKDFAIRYHYEP